MGEIGVVLDEAGDEGHAWWSVYDQEDGRGKVLMLRGRRVSGVSGGLMRGVALDLINTDPELLYIRIHAPSTTLSQTRMQVGSACARSYRV